MALFQNSYTYFTQWYAFYQIHYCMIYRSTERLKHRGLNCITSVTDQRFLSLFPTGKFIRIKVDL